MKIFLVLFIVYHLREVFSASSGSQDHDEDSLSEGLYSDEDDEDLSPRLRKYMMSGESSSEGHSSPGSMPYMMSGESSHEGTPSRTPGQRTPMREPSHIDFPPETPRRGIPMKGPSHTDSPPGISRQGVLLREPKHIEAPSKHREPSSSPEFSQDDLSQRFGRSMFFNEPSHYEVPTRTQQNSLRREPSEPPTPASQWLGKISVSAETTPTTSRAASMKRPNVEIPALIRRQLMMEDTPVSTPVSTPASTSVPELSRRRPGKELSIVKEKPKSEYEKISERIKKYPISSRLMGKMVRWESRMIALKQRVENVRLEQMHVKRLLGNRPSPTQKLKLKTKQLILSEKKRKIKRKINSLMNTF